jgi:hypothetical protein
MNGIRYSSLIRFLGLALLAACFNAGLASAQVFQGKFTLPSEAHWGKATLPAGDYAFTLDSVSPTCTLHLYQGRKGAGMIMAQAYDKAYSGRAELTMVGGTVRSLNLPDLGIVLQYAPQRAKAPVERELAQIVPVAAAGK